MSATTNHSAMGLNSLSGRDHPRGDDDDGSATSLTTILAEGDNTTRASNRRFASAAGYAYPLSPSNLLEPSLALRHSESSSFALFNHSSFDTFSDPGHDLQLPPSSGSHPFSLSNTPGGDSLPHHDSSDTATNDSGTTAYHHNSNMGTTISRRNTQMALPHLQGDDDSSDCSIGDISPIKFNYDNHYAASRELEGHRLELDQAPVPAHRITRMTPSSIHVASSRPIEPLQYQYHPYAEEIPVVGIPPTEASNLYEYEGYYPSHHLQHLSNPFYVIRSAAKAFEDCIYLLPCLQGIDLCQVHVSEHGHIRKHGYPTKEDPERRSLDTKIAKRRVESAICAFGGNTNPNRRQQAWSIFRVNKETMNAGHRRRHYEERLTSRYYLSGTRISWEVEEEPPICIDMDRRDDHTEKSGKGGSGAFRSGNRNPSLQGNPSGSEQAHGSHNASSPTSSGYDKDLPKMKYRCKLCGQPKQNHNCPYQQSLQRSIGVMVYPAVNSFTAAEPGTIAPSLTKMNNFVSYDSDQASLEVDHRSSALQATTTTETVAVASHLTTTASNLQPPVMGRPITAGLHPSAVTPEALRTNDAAFYNSPQSSLSEHSDEDTAATGTGGHRTSRHPMSSSNSSSKAQKTDMHRSNSSLARRQSQKSSLPSSLSGQKRAYSPPATTVDRLIPNSVKGKNGKVAGRRHDTNQGDGAAGTAVPPWQSRFVASVSLRPEHYRAVTSWNSPVDHDEKSTRDSKHHGADGIMPSSTCSEPPTTNPENASYQYPVIPLTFTERKRLSDALFCLSKQIPSMTNECAILLREVRRHPLDWDQAVAELLVQVVVGLYCSEGDTRLAGLQQYLLALGISC